MSVFGAVLYHFTSGVIFYWSSTPAHSCTSAVCPVWSAEKLLYTKAAAPTSHRQLIFPLKRQLCFSSWRDTRAAPSSVLGPQWEVITGPLANQQHPGLWSREKKLDTWHICEMKENVREKHLKDPEKVEGILSTPRGCWELCFGSTQCRTRLHKHKRFWSLRSFFKEKDSSQCCMKREHRLQRWHTTLTSV